jgi:hypothetical protein
MTSTCIYYVYAYIRSKDSTTGKAGTPYYIGKGKGRRAYSAHHASPVPKDKSRIIFLETNLTNVGACAIERRLIAWWGRKDLETGILLNRTDGGDGSPGSKVSEETRRKRSTTNKGRRGAKHSEETKKKISETKKTKLSGRKGEKRNSFTEETRKKMSEAKKGNKLSKEHINNISASMRGKIKSVETRKKMSEAHTNPSEETRKKMSEAKKGIPKEVVTCPHCGKQGGLAVMARWHFEKCHLAA